MKTQVEFRSSKFPPYEMDGFYMKRNLISEKLEIPCTCGRLQVREFMPADRDALLEFTQDPSQLRYMLFKLGSEKEVDHFLEFAATAAREEKRLEWHLALETLGEPGLIGSVALMIEKEYPSSAELGYWFKQSAWGKGYATEAAHFALSMGFRNLGLHRIWGKCHVENPASAHVMEKAGMRLEGTIREHAWLRDHYRSSLLFSILESEFNEK
jgi:RimJ/RimL family protein N-acetyltransferase